MLRAVLLMSAAMALLACQEAESKPLPRVLFAQQLGERALGEAETVPASEPAPSSVCPPEMALVEGNYCRIARHRCKRWLETKGRYRHWRCAEYAKPASCVLDLRKPMRFCIDRDEYADERTGKPLTGKTMVQAEMICRATGKRLCRESEWNFACEGEESRPYPYGWTRDSDVCNADKKTLVGTDDRMVSGADPPGSHPRCVSPFGVRDMSGNVEEWAVRDDYPNRGAMKGSYWIPSKNHCRAAQRIHGPQYSGGELGFRCCSEPEK